MNVLWITNKILPAPSKALNIPVAYSAGWVTGLSEQLKTIKTMNLVIATVYKGNRMQIFNIDGITYYLLPKSNVFYQRDLEPYWKEVCNKINPDIIHIHGTEYTIGLACMRACPNFKYVVSIQGLISVYANYYLGGIKTSELTKIFTLHRFLKFNTIVSQQRKFKKRGKFEIEMLKTTRHVIGRTCWDYAHARTINNGVNYHFCNEALREPFYCAENWNIKTKKNHVIFLSQAYYPLKGLHQVLKAVSFLKNDFPGIIVKIAGYDILDKSNVAAILKRTEYGAYIDKLVKEHRLENNIVFTGVLTEIAMIKEYQNAHVFVCPSSIENSPNSLGEAQMVGTPCISAYVGGVSDMVEHGKSGLLYRFEEVEMLAIHIKNIFKDDELACKLSNNGVLAAALRHNNDIILKNTIDIYQEIVDSV